MTSVFVLNSVNLGALGTRRPEVYFTSLERNPVDLVGPPRGRTIRPMRDCLRTERPEDRLEPVAPPTFPHDQANFEPCAEKVDLRLPLPLSVVGRCYSPAKLLYPSWCSPERLCTSSMSRCLRPDSRVRIIPRAEPQITMPAGIATARSGIPVASWYM